MTKLILLSLFIFLGSIQASGQEYQGSEPGAKPPSTSKKPNTKADNVSYLSYINYSAHVFVPRDADFGFDYGGGGCIQTKSTSSSAFFVQNVELPPGSVIDEITYYFYDISTSTSVLFLTEFNHSGQINDLIQITSTNGGFGSVTATNLDIPYDPENQSYALSIRINSISSDNEACGVRIGYFEPTVIRFK